MNKPHAVFAALLLCACTSAPFSWSQDETTDQTTSLPGEANKLNEHLRGEIVKIAQQYTEAVKNLPSVQQTQLTGLQKKMQDAGDLDSYLAVTKEIDRFTDALKAEHDPFEKIPELPDSALVEKPEALRLLQDQYLKAYKDKSDVRNKRIEDLARLYVTQLEALTKDLTIKGRIRDAIATKKEVERTRKGLDDKTFLLQAMSGAPIKVTTVNVETNAASDTPIYGKIPEWSKWQFDRTGNFAGDANLFAHPDLPDQLTIDFRDKTGRGRIYGRCDVEKQTVDMRECVWFGKAIQWKIKDFSTLNATINLQSTEIAGGDGYGPKAYLLLLNDKGPIGEGLAVTMLWKTITLTVAKDPDANRCTLGWAQGKIKKTYELPASGSVRLILGISLRNPGERCDTNISMQ